MAPIFAAGSGQVTSTAPAFWAAGANCCEDRRGFHCGGADDGGPVRSGYVLPADQVFLLDNYWFTIGNPLLRRRQFQRAASLAVGKFSLALPPGSSSSAGGGEDAVFVLIQKNADDIAAWMAHGRVMSSLFVHVLAFLVSFGCAWRMAYSRIPTHMAEYWAEEKLAPVGSPAGGRGAGVERPLIPAVAAGGVL